MLIIYIILVLLLCFSVWHIINLLELQSDYDNLRYYRNEFLNRISILEADSRKTDFNLEVQSKTVDRLNIDCYNNYKKIFDIHNLLNLEYLPKQPEKLVFKSSKSKKNKV